MLGKYRLIKEELVFFNCHTILLAAGTIIEAIRLSAPDDQPDLATWAVMQYDCVGPNCLGWRGTNDPDTDFRYNLEKIEEIENV